MKNKITSKNKFFDFGILLIISALVYLPNIHLLGYYKDDWYLMYSAHTQGPEIFKAIFMIDRPARGELLMFLYRFFGDNPLYYNLSAYIFRFLSAIGFLWIVRMVWPSKRTATLFMAILFMLYPGYLSGVNGIDFQAHVVSLCFAVFSIALSLRSISLNNSVLSYSAALISILLGWAYLGLVEYSIGLEVFRFCCYFVVLSRNSDQRLYQKVVKTLRKIFLYLIIPVGFLFWRSFIFQNERRATDVGSQFDELFSSPILTGFRWGVYVLQDMLNVILLAWGVPVYQIAFQLRLRNALIGIAISIIILVLVHFVISNDELEPENGRDGKWRTEALWLGILAVLASILPVIATNRHIDFSEFSRYALPGSLGGVLVLTSILYHLDSPRIRIGITYLFITIAAFIHYANTIQAGVQAASVREFWWQVSWRVPQIREGTTLIARYAESGIPESYVVWGPANIIYYPEKHAERPVKLKLPAVILNNDSITKITTKSNKEDISVGRSWTFQQDYQNILVISQASSSSCVRVINGAALERSTFEDYGISMVAPHSNIEDVLINQNAHIPPHLIFGPEPDHGWCYYFQKADLARQAGDWNEVARLGNEAQKLGLHPNDQIEWMPFLQAYSILGDVKQVRDISKRIDTENYYKLQTCQIMTSMDKLGYPLSPDMDSQIQQLFCPAGQ